VRQQLLLVRQNSFPCVVCVCLSHSSLAKTSKQAPNCARKNAITRLAVICRRHAAPSTQAAACFLFCALPPHVRIRRAASSSATRCGEGGGRDGLTASGPGGLAALGALNFAAHVFFLCLFVVFDGSMKDRRSSTNPSVSL
jgi:hypothetical protein